MRRGLRPTPCTVTAEPGTIAAATRNGAADEMSPGISTSASCSRGRTLDRDARRASRDARARALEEPLGVVARRDRLDHGRAALAPARRRGGPPTSPAPTRPAARSRSPAAPRPRRRAARGRRSSPPSRPSAGAALRRAPSGAPRATRRRRARSGPSWPARSPARSRMSVPAFPQSIGASGCRSPRKPDSAHAQDVDVLLDDVDAERAHRRDRRLGVRGAPEARRSPSLPRRPLRSGRRGARSTCRPARRRARRAREPARCASETEWGQTEVWHPRSSQPSCP